MLQFSQLSTCVFKFIMCNRLEISYIYVHNVHTCLSAHRGQTGTIYLKYAKRAKKSNFETGAWKYTVAYDGIYHVTAIYFIVPLYYINIRSGVSITFELN